MSVDYASNVVHYTLAIGAVNVRVVFRKTKPPRALPSSIVHKVWTSIFPSVFCILTASRVYWPQYIERMPKRTYQPSKKKRMTTHGFLTRKGGNVLQARRRKGRARLAVKPSR